VPIEFFVGRIKEIERLRNMVMASVQGRFKIGFVSGERGIGKSSLVSFVRHLSDRESDTAGCHVFLGGVKELNEMVRRTFDRLLKESMDKPWHSRVKDFLGNYIREVGLFGVSLELALKDTELSAITHDFVRARRSDATRNHRMPAGKGCAADNLQCYGRRRKIIRTALPLYCTGGTSCLTASWN
jgi:hypothetical protein